MPRTTRKVASASPRKRAKPAPERPAPAALAERVAKVAAKARAQNEVRARELIALVQDKLRTAASAFYDIGVALAELSSPPLYTAAGYRSFAALVRTELGFSADKARQLITVAQGLKRTTALSLGPARAAAVIALTRATPEDDTPEEVARGKVTVRGHRKPVRPADMSAREIARAAATERRSHRAKATGTTDAEAWLDALVARLRRVDPHATARLVERRRKGERATTGVSLEASLASLRKVFGG
jgi:hypothetical protein